MHTKKLFYIALFFLTASGFAQDKIKITNTFGADKDSISSRDFLDVNHFSYFEYDVADRIQFDYSSDLFIHYRFRYCFYGSLCHELF